MSNTELHNYIERSAKPQFLDQLPYNFCIHGLNKHLVYGNSSAMQTLGFNKSISFTDTTYANLPCSAASDHINFEKQDDYVLSRNLTLRFLGYHCYANDDWRIMLGEKSPLCDDENKIIGLISHWQDVTHDSLVDLSRILISKKNFPRKQKYFSFSINNNLQSNTIKLSKRQTETLFYTLRGYNRRDIAKLLNLSSRTIETYAEQLKNKFSCESRIQLIEKAIVMGYMNIIPDSLLR